MSDRKIISYADYIASRSAIDHPVGFEVKSDLSKLFDYQKAIAKWACRRGKAAIFAETGLGKTAMQCAWADEVANETGKPTLLLAPLAVSIQTVHEAEKFGLRAKKWSDDGEAEIHIANYEQLANLNAKDYGGIVLDESSILKGMNGKLRASITAFGSSLPFRLSCTATPSPNDWMELGTQAEFLGVMSQMEMLAMFFTHDSARTSKWRLKGHAKGRFFEWMATWAVVVKSPSDLGFDGSRFELPPLHLHEYIVGEKTLSDKDAESLGLQDRARIRKLSMVERVEKAAEIANSHDKQCLVWCHMNDESKSLCDAIPGAIEVTGSDKPAHKEKALIGFGKSEFRVLVSKPRIAGFGMNYQQCNQTIFTGLSDSWEQYYQAVRRVWRFGQTSPVDAHIVSGADEGAVLANIKRKDSDNAALSAAMLEHASKIFLESIGAQEADRTDYSPSQLIQVPFA